MRNPSRTLLLTLSIAFVTLGAPRPTEAASLRGNVKLDGPAPEQTSLTMKSDAKCAEANPDGRTDERAIVGENGALANAFVYVSQGATAKGKPATEPVVLANDGCMFSPHVVGVRVGQPLHLRNADKTEHKLQSLSKQNRRLTATLAVDGKPVEKKLEAEEVMIRLKCNAHLWESAYVGVLPHGFFAISGTDGTYSIDGLEPGSYTLTAWHETFGAAQQKVTIEAEVDARADFTFKPEPS